MIISHKHRFIFIKTEKTAGTSIEIALSKYCGPSDVITGITENDERFRKEQGFRSAQNFYVPFSKYKKIDWAKFFLQRKRASFYNHMSAEEIKDLVPGHIWKSYYKFCFDRNPWDKFLSWYYWKNKDNSYKSIDDFFKEGMAGKVKGFDLYTIGGVLAVDDVFKYENLSKSLDVIRNKLGFEEPIQISNISAKSASRKKRNHYSEILSENHMSLIDIYAAREIKLLGYSRGKNENSK